MSDIVGEGMSLNKGHKDIPVTPEEDEAWNEIPLRTWSEPDDNDWQIPVGLVEALKKESCNCCDHDDCDVYATTYNEGYDGGLQDSMLRATQIERILQDLIAELRAINRVVDAEYSVDVLADRAEDRLREVQGE